MPEAAEAIDDDEGVRDFITTVPYIEELTGLDFGSAVRDADLYEFADGPEREVASTAQGCPVERSRNGSGADLEDGEKDIARVPQRRLARPWPPHRLRSSRPGDTLALTGVLLEVDRHFAWRLIST